MLKQPELALYNAIRYMWFNYLPRPAKQWTAILLGTSYFDFGELFTLLVLVASIFEHPEFYVEGDLGESKCFWFDVLPVFGLESYFTKFLTKANQVFTTALGGFLPSGKARS